MTYLNANNEIITPFFSKKIHIRERKGGQYFSLDGTITFRGITLRVNKVTNKKITNPNRKWLEKNLYQTLWELSDFYKEIEKEKLELAKMKHIPTVKEFGWKSLKMNSSNRKVNTQNGLERHFKGYIIPFFGERQLHTIKPSELQEFQTTLFEKGLSGKYIKNIRSVFQTILEDALNDELIGSNPFKKVKQPKVIKTKIDPFTLDEIQLILKEINPKHKPMFVLAFFSGMRWGEIIALEWRHIDFNENEISITQSMVEKILDTPKTQNSNRDIDMLPIVKEYLQIQKDRNLSDRWVFVNQYKDNYVRTDSLNLRIFKPLLDELGLERRPVRQTRHSFASMMLSKGEDILWVSNMLGHTETSLTLNTYSKYIKQKKIIRGGFLDDVEI